MSLFQIPDGLRKFTQPVTFVGHRKAKETISYGIPAFTLNGLLVWFAAHKNHIGFYPRASAIAAFKKELSAYKGAKGSVQFPFDKPLPRALISRMVKFRMKQNLSKKK